MINLTGLERNLCSHMILKGIATAAEIRDANPNFGQIINCVFIDCDRSRGIKIFGVKFFHQKVLKKFKDLMISI